MKRTARRAFAALFAPLAGLILLLSLLVTFVLGYTEFLNIKSTQLSRLSLANEILLAGFRRPLDFFEGVANQTSPHWTFRSSSREVRRGIEEELVALLSFNPLFQSAFWVDGRGRELVRVQRGRDGRPLISSESDLHDVADTPAFREALHLHPGRIYLSPLELEQLGDATSNINRPVMTFYLRLPMVDGADQGMLGLVLQADAEIERMWQTDRVTHRLGNLKLLDEEGFVVAGNGAENLFPAPGTGLLLAESAPDLWAEIEPVDAGQTLHSGGLWSWAAVRPSAERGSVVEGFRNLKLATHLHFGQLVARLILWVWPVFLITLIALAACALLVLRYQLLWLQKEESDSELALLNQKLNAEERLQVVTEGADVGVWSYDLLDGNVEATPRCRRHLGLDGEKRIELDEFYGALMPADRSRVREALDAAIRQVSDYHVEFRAVWPDESVHWVACAGRAFGGADGRTVRIAGVTMDVTELRTFEAELLRSSDTLRLATEGADVGIWNWDMRSGRLEWSQRCRVHLALPEGKQPNFDHFYAVLDPRDRDRVRRRIEESVSTGRDYYEEFRVVRSDGSVRWIAGSGRIRFAEDGALLAMTGVTIDVTDRHLAAMEMQELNASLERKVQERTAQLAAVSAAKSQFLANMSHEIRTPMNAVIGLSNLLRDTPLAGEQRDYVEKIHLAGTALLGVLNDILDYSKVEAGQLQLESEPVRIGDILKKCGVLFAVQAEEKHIRLELPPPPRLPGGLLGDPLRLLQVLNNLVGNALKFTERGFVRVEVSLAEEAQREVILKFSVTDTGIGMESGVKNRIFDPFHQHDRSTTRKFGGSGLGLSISKRLVEMMGGEIGVTSTPGEGSTFWFTVKLAKDTSPARRPAAEEAPAGTSAPAFGELAPAARGAHVLVVDDNATNLLVARQYLRKMGLAVETADSGKEAVEKASTGTFDIIFMDLQMPEMDGFAATRLIRAAEAAEGSRPVPIIALSAAAMMHDVREAQAAGMNDHVAKPIDAERLAEVIGRWLPGVQAEDSGSASSGLGPVLDERTAAASLGSPQLYRSLLRSFAGDFADAIGRVDAAATSGDAGSARALLKDILLIAPTIGAAPLSAAATKFDACLQRGDWAGREAFEKALADVLRVINERHRA